MEVPIWELPTITGSIERDLTCGISSISLVVPGNEVEIEYGSAVFSSGLRTGYDEAVRL